MRCDVCGVTWEQHKGLRESCKEIQKIKAEVGRLRERIAEDNAVCLCGCPPEAHESLGEDGEQCEHEEHVCLRVPKGVAAEFARLGTEVERLREENQSLYKTQGNLSSCVDESRRIAYERGKRAEIAEAEVEWLRDLVAGAKPLVEMWAATFGAQLDWKKEWIARAQAALRGK